MRRLLLLHASLLALAPAPAALAAHHVPNMGVWGNGPQPGPFVGPTLTSVTVPEGRLTQKGMGAVRFSSLDNSTYSPAYPWKGLDMWNGDARHTPVSYTITPRTTQSGTHFGFGDGSSCMGGGAHVFDGSALTPVPCPAGVSAGLNAGNYAWDVTATDALGFVSNTAVLTYDTTTAGLDCSLNVGGWITADRTVFPSSFTTGGSAVACPSPFFGNRTSKILVSVGFEGALTDNILLLQNQNSWACASTSPCVPYVTMQWADGARPGGLGELELKNMSYIKVSGLTSSSDDGGQRQPKGIEAGIQIIASGVGCTAACIFVDNFRVENPAAASSRKVMYGLYTACSNWVEVSNSTFHHVYKGWTTNDQGLGDATGCNSQHILIRNTVFRWFASDASFYNHCDYCELRDVAFLSPMRDTNIHMDSAQFAVGEVVSHFKATRVMVAMAGGSATMQGAVFESRSGDDTGAWIDDGSAGPSGSSGVAGHVLHIATKGTATMSQGPAPIVGAFAAAPAVNVLAAGTETLDGCKDPTPSLPTTCDINIDQLVGSSTNRFRVMSAPLPDIQLDGIIYAAQDYNGAVMRSESGTSFLKHFTIVKDDGYGEGVQVPGMGINFFTATVTNVACTASGGYCPKMTITSPMTGDGPGLWVIAEPPSKVMFPSTLASPCIATATWLHPTANCTDWGSTGLKAIEVTASATSVRKGGSTYGVSLTGNGSGGTSGTYLLQAGALSGGLGASSGTINVAVAVDIPQNFGPSISIGLAPQPLQHQGTMTLTSGFVWDKLDVSDNTLGLDPAVTVPANYSISHLHFGCLSTRIVNSYTTDCGTAGTTLNQTAAAGALSAHNKAVAAFAACTGQAGGCDPQVYLAGKTRTYWDGRTDAQVICEVAGLLVPKAAGVLDNGDGTWDAAVKPDGMGLPIWNDGSGVALCP